MVVKNNFQILLVPNYRVFQITVIYVKSCVQISSFGVKVLGYMIKAVDEYQARAERRSRPECSRIMENGLCIGPPSVINVSGTSSGQETLVIQIK